MNKITLEAIIITIMAPVIGWFISFVISSYQSQAEISNIKSDILEIKKDTRFIRNYLLEKK
jgi:cell division protein FtsL